MRRWNYVTDIMVTPTQLQDFAWSAPMRDLATQLDLSDVGLKKILQSHGIFAPPQGYWNKFHAGKPVPPRPTVRARRPGETGRLRLDKRFAPALTSAQPLSADGPFASAAVPEDLDTLRAQELKAIGQVKVASHLRLYHPGLRSIMTREARLREKAAASSYSWHEPQFDNPVAQRRLRILNAIFLTLAKRGHTGGAGDRDGEIHADVIVGDTYVGLDLSVAGTPRTVLRAGRRQPDPALPASTPLLLRVGASAGAAGGEVFQDDDAGRLETKIAAITASIIVAGEARFRQSLREAIARQEQQRVADEEARQRKLVELNRKRIEELHVSGELLRKAEELRTLVARVKAAVRTGSTSGDEATIDAWETWALAEADKIDPVMSGQIHAHLREPSLPLDSDQDLLSFSASR